MNPYMNAYIYIGFIADLAEGLCKVPATRLGSLRVIANAMIHSKGVRFQARKLASLMGTIISTKLAWAVGTYHTSLYKEPLSYTLYNCFSKLLGHR